MGRWNKRGLKGEPPLEELLTDPALKAVLERDGVTLTELDMRILQARTSLFLSRQWPRRPDSKKSA